MKFQVEVPDAVFATLATLAEQRGVRISELLAEPLGEAIKDTLNPHRRRGARRWALMTPQREALLIELHAAGKNQSEVAAQVGVSVSSVKNHARRLGLRFDATRKPRTTERTAA